MTKNFHLPGYISIKDEYNEPRV